jgi:hypothetical protein
MQRINSIGKRTLVCMALIFVVVILAKCAGIVPR